jgi:hypothetical protein
VRCAALRWSCVTPPRLGTARPTLIPRVCRYRLRRAAAGSDRVDVFNGQRWGWTSDHTLSEARFAMGTAALALTLSDGATHVVGLFAGGIGRAGNLFLVDLYDFAADR